jgi:hypothetical protein
MTIPASFSTATLFPCAAIRVKRPALPFSDVEREEKVSLWWWLVLPSEGEGGGKYRRVNNALVACIVVDVDCDAAKGRDFGR